MPQREEIGLPLGDTLITIAHFRYNNTSQPFFLHIHHNEQTADSVLHDYLSLAGGAGVSIQNNRQRLVRFPLAGTRYLFDPNRMFTPQGIDRSLALLSRRNAAAAAAVAQFADSLLSYLPDTVALIAIHNNTDGAYSLLDYSPGRPLAKEADSVFRNPAMDPDDFVFTTSRDLFAHLRQRNVSVVLQNNIAATNDGSLGYVFGKSGRFYVNIEAQHGHFAEQAALVRSVLSYVAPQTQ